LEETALPFEQPSSLKDSAENQDFLLPGSRWGLAAASATWE
jgi:hypothetical protein